jgi:hypothetical protein
LRVPDQQRTTPQVRRDAQHPGNAFELRPLCDFRFAFRQASLPGQEPAKTPNSKSGDNLVSYKRPKINRENKCQGSGL